MIMPTKGFIQASVDLLESQLNELGYGQRSRVLTIQVLPPSIYLHEIPLTLSDHPACDLWALGKALLAGEDDAETVIADMVHDRVIGWLLCHEMVTNLHVNPAEVVLSKSGIQSFPGTKRTRVVMGMDILGRCYRALRPEGEQPVWTGSAEPILSGSLPTALRDLNLAVASGMPDAQTYLKALSNVEILSRDEMDAHVMTVGPHARGLIQPADNSHLDGPA